MKVINNKWVDDAIRGYAMLVARLALPLLKCMWKYEEWKKARTQEETP